MIAHITDGQIVGETVSTLLSTVQQGPVSMLVTIKNSGVNVASYRWQEFNGTAFVDMGVIGTDLNNTLSANEVKSYKLTSSYAQVQLVGNASGGAFLEFSITRYFNRPSGGSIPILSL